MFEDLLALLFPESCFACEGSMARGERYICTACNIKLPYTSSHVLGSADLNAFQRRFWGKLPIRFVFAYLHFVPKGRVQRLLHKLKYKGAQELGEHLGKRYGALLDEHQFTSHFDVVLPVPLYKSKLRRRGYNQSECFAKGLAVSMGLPLEAQGLVRLVDTSTQTRKNRLDRWQNVEQVFEIGKQGVVEGKRVLLVDDVMTTGATLEACAKALLEAGAIEVSVVAIAAA